MAGDPSKTAETNPADTRLTHGNDSSTAQTLKCGLVADLVNSTEARLCGQNQIGTRSFVEGLAHLGLPAATRLEVNRAANLSLPDPAPGVYHTFSQSGGFVPVYAPIALVAGSHQDAVDHCLIAHQFATHLNAPVYCVVDSALREQLGCAQLPEPSTFLPLGTDATHPEEASLNACFEVASTALGRDHRAVKSFGSKQAKQALIACGRLAALARKLIEQDCFSVATCLLQLGLLRPLPKQQLLQQLKDTETLLVLTQSDDPIAAELQTAIETLAAERPSFPSISHVVLPEAPQNISDVTRALAPKWINIESKRIRCTKKNSIPPLQISVTPGGPWSRQLLVDSAALLMRATCPATDDDSVPVRLNEAPASSYSGLILGGSEEIDRFDLLVCTENDLVNVEPAVERIREGGSIIFHMEGTDFLSVDRWLSATSQQMIADKKIDTWWIRPGDHLVADDDVTEASYQLLSGAILKALAAKLNLDDSGFEAARISNLERTGIRAVQRFDFSPLNTGNSNAGSMPPKQTNRNQLPNDGKDWIDAIRNFHLTGHGAYNEMEPLPGLPLWPALASQLLDEHPAATHYPQVLPVTSAGTERNQTSSLHRLLSQSIGDNDNDNDRVDDHLDRILQGVDQVIHPTPSSNASDVLNSFINEISTHNGNNSDLEKVKANVSRILESSQLVGMGPETHCYLYFWAITSQRHEQKASFDNEIEKLIDGLKSLMYGDASVRESELAPSALAASMGEDASTLIDWEKLSLNLPRVGGSQLTSIRLQELVRETLRSLQNFQSSQTLDLNCYFIAPPESLASLPKLPKTMALSNETDCFEYALGLVTGLLESMTEVFRAVRVARLLIAGQYQPKLHDGVFARFEWQSCNGEELQLLPKVVVLETLVGIKSKQLETSLSRLLRSGRPVHVLVTQDDAGLAAHELSGAQEDLGLIALAHREAFVLQSTLAHPDHLLAGLHEMSHTVRPSIAFVSSHQKRQCGDWAWASELISHYGRCAPCFLYSPDRGPGWSDRFDLSGNPQPETVLPAFELACDRLANLDNGIRESVTFAHAAALYPEFRKHFRLIPREWWSDAEELIGHYLEKFTSVPPDTVPYLWVLREGKLCRAIMTREMANACRESSIGVDSP